jgi:hypothetical protein
VPRPRTFRLVIRHCLVTEGVIRSDTVSKQGRNDEEPDPGEGACGESGLESSR